MDSKTAKERIGEGGGRERGEIRSAVERGKEAGVTRQLGRQGGGGGSEGRRGGAGSPGMLQAKPEPARPTHEYYSTCPSCCSMLYLLVSVVSAAGCCCSVFIGLCSTAVLLLPPRCFPSPRSLTRSPRQDPIRRHIFPSSCFPISIRSLSQAPKLLIVSSRLHIDHCNS